MISTSPIRHSSAFIGSGFCTAADSKLSKNQADGGRATYWAAKALKARLLLTRASETGDQQLYEQAYTEAKDVIDNGPFELNKDFNAVFDMRQLGGEGSGNNEVIWYVDYSSENQLYNEEFDDIIIRSGGNHMHLSYCMEYDTQHEGLAFIPLSPILETGSVLVWKKNNLFSPATSLFIQEINLLRARIE